MTVLLRKLTRKSIIDFGRYNGRSIQNMLDLYEYRYIRWMYFCNSNLTFFDDILDEVNLPEDFRIKKPGVDKEANKRLNELRGSGIGKNWKKESHLQKGRKIEGKIKVANRRRRERVYFSKSSMQARNQCR